MAEHIVIWHIDKGRIESDSQEEGNTGWNVETLSERVQRDLKFYNCSRIHSVNGYGCAFLDGNLSDIILDLAKYPSCLKFRVRPASDPNQVGLVFEKMKEGAQPLDMDTVLGTSVENFRNPKVGDSLP